MWRTRIIILIMIFIGLGIWGGIQDIHEANLAEVRKHNIAMQNSQEPKIDESALAATYQRIRLSFSAGYIAFCISLVLLLKKLGYWLPPNTIDGSEAAHDLPK